MDVSSYQQLTNGDLEDYNNNGEVQHVKNDYACTLYTHT